MENKKYQLKVEIEIPELNLKGEMKPLKSNELLYQLEQILQENGLSYRLSTSAYKEEKKLSDEEKQEIIEAALDDVFETKMFNDLPLSAQDLYCNLSDMADEDGVVFEPNIVLEKLKAKQEDVFLLEINKFIIVHKNKIVIFALALASVDIESLEMNINESRDK